MPDLPAILGLDVPESSERTRQIGHILAEATRALCYATLGDAPGLEDPGDVYTLLGHLYTATSRLSQVCIQQARFLDTQARAGRLADGSGDDPRLVAARAAHALGASDSLARQLTGELQKAQNAIAGLGLRDEPEEDPDA